MAKLATLVLLLSACATAGDDNPDAAPGPDARRVDASTEPDARVAPPCVEGDLQVQAQDTGHCYMYFDNNTSWAAAEAACQAVGADVFLATITSAQENALASSVVPNVEVWLGGNDLVAEMTFVWVSGESFEYTNWRAGEPNNGDNEDCITFQAQLGGVWDDRDCGDNQRVLCERD